MWQVSRLAKNLVEKQQKRIRLKVEVSNEDVLQDELGLETYEVPKEFFNLCGVGTRFTTVGEEAEEFSVRQDGQGGGGQLIRSATFSHGQRVVVPDGLVLEEFESPCLLYDYHTQQFCELDAFLERYHLRQNIGFDPPKDPLIEVAAYYSFISLSPFEDKLGAKSLGDDPTAPAGPNIITNMDEEDPSEETSTRPTQRRKRLFPVNQREPSNFLHFEIWKPCARVKFRSIGDVMDYHKETVYQSSHMVDEVLLGYRLVVKDFDIVTNIPLNFEELGLDVLSSPGVVPLGGRPANVPAWTRGEEQSFIEFTRHLLITFFKHISDGNQLASFDVVGCRMADCTELRKEMFSDMEGRSCCNGHLMTAIACSKLHWTRPAPCIGCGEPTLYKAITCKKRCEMSGYCEGCEAEDAFKGQLKVYVEEAAAQERLNKRIEKVEGNSFRQLRTLGEPLCHDVERKIRPRDTQLYLRFLLVTNTPEAEFFRDPWQFEENLLKHMTAEVFPTCKDPVSGLLLLPKILDDGVTENTTRAFSSGVLPPVPVKENDNGEVEVGGTAEGSSSAKMPHEIKKAPTTSPGVSASAKGKTGTTTKEATASGEMRSELAKEHGEEYQKRVLEALQQHEVANFGSSTSSSKGSSFCHPQLAILRCFGNPITVDIVLLHPRVAQDIIPRTRHHRRENAHEQLLEGIIETRKHMAPGNQNIVRLDLRYHKFLHYLDSGRAPADWLRSEVLGLVLTRGKLETAFPVRNNRLTYNFKTRLRFVQCVQCGEEGFQDSLLQTHKSSECSMREVICSGGCGIKLLARDLDEHLAKDCVKRGVTCPLCSATVVFEELPDHMRNCEYRPWQCRAENQRC
eukprot:g12298.t1